MPDHANYEAYSYEDIVAALFAITEVQNDNKNVADDNGVPSKHQPGNLGRKADSANGKGTGGEGFAKAWPASMLRAAEKIDAVAQSISLALPELAKSITQLVGPSGAWTGPAAGSFKRITEGIHQVAYETVVAAQQPDWRNMLNGTGYRMSWTQQQFWQGYEAGWRVVFPASAGYPAVVRWDPEYAAAFLRPYVRSLGETYDFMRPQFAAPPKSVAWEVAPPPEDPQKKIDDIQKDANKKIEDLQNKFDQKQKELQDNFDKQLEKREKAFDKAEDKFNKAQDKFANDLKAQQKDFDKKAEQFNKDLKDAQKPPPIPEPPKPPEVPKPPELQKPPGLDDLGAPPPPIGLDKGVPVPGGLDVTGDGKADLDAKGNPLPGFNPAKVPGGFDVDGDGKADLDEAFKPLPGFDLADPKDFDFTLPGAKPPPGADVPVPIAPPPGTQLVFDKNGKLVALPPGAELPGRFTPGGRLGGSTGVGDLAPPPTPRFVRPPSADDALTALGPGKQPPPLSNFDSPDGRTSPFGRPVGGNSQPGAPGPGPAGRPGGAPQGLLPPGAGGFGPGLLPGAGAGMMPPMMPMGGMSPMGAGGQQQGERERQTWLLEDDEIWSDDEDPGPAVVGRVTDDDDEEEEFTPRY